MSKPLTMITGALGTIGKAAALKFSAMGHQLILVDLHAEPLEKWAEHIPNSIISAVDITNAQAVIKLFDTYARQLDNAILCAGIEGPVGNLEDIADEDFQKVMGVNVIGVWLCMKYAIRFMKQKKSGNIVVMSSISGVMGMPTMSPYCASKHAVTGLVKTAAREVAASGVRVNAVCSGPVTSDMMTRIDGTLLQKYPERLKGETDASAFVPMQRYARPEEIAETLFFLCSSAGSYITGTSMMIDGGLTCR